MIGGFRDAEVHAAQLLHSAGKTEKVDIVHNGGVRSEAEQLAKIALVNGHRPADLAERELFGEMLVDILNHRNDLAQIPVVADVALGEETLAGEMRPDPQKVGFEI